MRPTAYFRPFLALALCACAMDEPTRAVDLPVFTAVEELRVGSADDPETALTYFRSLAVSAAGRIYTAHRNESTIRVTAEDGSLIRTIGRQGGGPGEFQGLLNIGIRGDTLWAFDSNTYRFTLFDLDGELLGTRGFQIDLGDRTNVPPRPSGMLHDGTIYGSRPAFSHEVADGTLTETAVVRFDRGGAIIDTIAVHDWKTSTWRMADPNSSSGLQSFRGQPFSEAQLLSISPVAAEVVTVDRAVPRDGAPPTFRVTKLTFEGDTIFSRTFPYEPVPIGEGVADSLARDFAAGLKDLPAQMQAGAPTYEHGVELALAALHLPPHRPPVTGVSIGYDGTIWLAREQSPSPVTAYWILSAGGEPIGAVQLPRGFQLLAADATHAWGSASDELDVPYIVRYAVDPGEPAT